MSLGNLVSFKRIWVGWVGVGFNSVEELFHSLPGL